MATTGKKKQKTTGKTRSKSMKTPPVEAQQGETTEHLKTDFMDEFLFHAANFVYMRKKLFISLALLLVIMLISGYGTFRFIQHKDDLRNEKIFEIEKIIHDTSLSEENRFKKAIPLLDNCVKEYEGTKQYTLALFYRSGLNYKQKQYAEAESDLKGVLLDVEKQSELFVLASLYLANVFRDQQKTEQAVEVLQAAKTESMADIVLMELANIYDTTDQKDKARETLQILTQDYPKSNYAGKAKQLLEML